jgi:hypothetical protein
MLVRNICIVSLRLTAIYILTQAINLLPTWYSIYLVYTSASLSVIILGISVIIGTFVLPVIIWGFSKRIAITMTQFIEPAENTVSQSNVNYSTVIINAVGLLIFALAFPDLIVLMYQFIIAALKTTSDFQAPTPDPVLFVSVFLKLIFSLILIFKSVWLKTYIFKSK